MTKVKELTTAEEKLRALFELQRNDSKIDEIRTLRGELPIEVKELEDAVMGLGVRIDKLKEEVDKVTSFISGKNTSIKESKALIAKYKEQLNLVKNDREHTALNKEIEMQNLEVDLAKKKIGDAQKEEKSKQAYLDESQGKQDKIKADLEQKKKELDVIIEETEKEEAELHKLSEVAREKIERRLLAGYDRIRKTYRNGLAVVTFERDSCGGCFGKIPPQRQLEIKQRKKIILCEHCGRILVDPTFGDINSKALEA